MSIHEHCDNPRTMSVQERTSSDGKYKILLYDICHKYISQSYNPYCVPNIQWQKRMKTVTVNKTQLFTIL